MKPWAAINIPILREDAAAGLTLQQCAGKRGWNPATVAKHARLNQVVFSRGLVVRRRVSEDEAQRWALERCQAQLREEIARARAEMANAPLFKGRID